MKKSIILAGIFLMLSSANLFASEKITLATVSWPPFYGENLPKNGFISELSREAFKRAGYKTEFLFVP